MNTPPVRPIAPLVPLTPALLIARLTRDAGGCVIAECPTCHVTVKVAAKVLGTKDTCHKCHTEFQFDDHVTEQPDMPPAELLTTHVLRENDTHVFYNCAHCGGGMQSKKPLTLPYKLECAYEGCGKPLQLLAAVSSAPPAESHREGPPETKPPAKDQPPPQHPTPEHKEPKNAAHDDPTFLEDCKEVWHDHKKKLIAAAVLIFGLLVWGLWPNDNDAEDKAKAAEVATDATDNLAKIKEMLGYESDHSAKNFDALLSRLHELSVKIGETPTTLVEEIKVFRTEVTAALNAETDKLKEQVASMQSARSAHATQIAKLEQELAAAKATTPPLNASGQLAAYEKANTELLAKVTAAEAAQEELVAIRAMLGLKSGEQVGVDAPEEGGRLTMTWPSGRTVTWTAAETTAHSKEVAVPPPGQ